MREFVEFRSSINTRRRYDKWRLALDDPWQTMGSRLPVTFVFSATTGASHQGAFLSSNNAGDAAHLLLVSQLIARLLRTHLHISATPRGEPSTIHETLHVESDSLHTGRKTVRWLSSITFDLPDLLEDFDKGLLLGVKLIMAGNQPAPQSLESPQALKTWWNGFKKRTKKDQNQRTYKADDVAM